MIRITSLELNNFQRHKHFRHEFDGSNVLMLTGENGEGKTVIQTAIKFALRGMVFSVDKKAPQGRCVRLPAKSASVIMEFMVDGTRPAKITRGITAGGKNSRCLEFEGKTYTSDADVDEQMTKMLGADLKAIDNLVFIPQGTLDTLFVGTPSERQDLWAKLTAVSGNEKVASIVDSAAKRLGSNVADFTVALQLAKDRIGQQEAVAATAEAALVDLPNGENLQALADYVGQMSLAMDRRENAQDSVTRLKDAVGLVDEGTFSDAEVAAERAGIDASNALIVELTTAKSTQAQLRESLAAKELGLKNAQVLAAALAVQAEAQAALDSIEAQKPKDVSSQYAQVDLLQVAGSTQRLVDTQAELTALATTIPGLQAEENSTAEAGAVASDLKVKAGERCAQLLNEGINHAKLLAALSSASAGCCPACGQAVSGDVGDHVRDLVAKNKAEAAEAAAEFNQALEAHNKAAAAHAWASKVWNQATSQAATLAASAKKLEEFLARMPSVEDAAALIKEHQERLAVSSAWAANRNSASAALTAASRAADAAALPDLPELSVASAEVASLRLVVSMLPSNATHDAKIAHAREELNNKAAHLREMLAKIESIRAVKQQYATAVETVEREHALLNALAADAADDIKVFLASVGVVTRNSLATLQEKLAQDLEQWRAATSDASSSRKVLESFRTSVDEIEAKIEAQKQKVDLIADLKLLSDVFSSSGAQADYLAYEFGRLAVDVQDYLAEIGAAFTVMPSETSPLAFEFLKLGEPDATWLHQSQFSGGQRVTLALGIIHTCHRLFIPSVGILCLDEPSLHLSTSAKEQLAAWIRGVEASGDLQLVVCDHEPAVVAAAGTVIEFPL